MIEYVNIFIDNHSFYNLIVLYIYFIVKKCIYLKEILFLSNS